MQLRDYIAFARKWAWLIVLLTLLAATVSYAYSLRIPPTYRAETTILVGQEQAGSTVTSSDLFVSNNLAQAYTLLATQPKVLQAAADEIKWQEGWQSLYFRVNATTSGGQLIRISATSDNPEEARVIVDEVARQMILQSPISKEQKQAEEQRDFVTQQQKILQAQIEAAQARLTDFNTQATLENDEEKLKALNERITALQSKVDIWQKNYADLSATLSRASTKFLTVLAPAQTPRTPISPDLQRNVLIAALAGAALAIALGYVFDYLDDTIKSSDDVQRELALSTLGAITRIAGMKNPADALVTIREPRSPISEAYRVLRTNLRFSGIENPNSALLVTSALSGEGKTTTAANLAIALAQAGKRVVLVDSDLRRPALHKLFGLHNHVGISTLFLDDAPPLDQVFQNTAIPGLRVITSGVLPPNPAEVLDSKRMNELVNALRDDSDMVILDSPPCLAVADASILGSRCSGAILVINAGHTRTDVAQRAAETLLRTNVKLLGAVLNKMSFGRSGSRDYYYYHYYGKYGARSEKKSKPREKSGARLN